jgi:hypothetical protein
MRRCGLSDKTADVVPGSETAVGDSDVPSAGREALARDAAGAADGGEDAGGGGPDLRMIVLLIVLAPFVIAMILALVERFKTDSSEVIVEGVAMPEGDASGARS